MAGKFAQAKILTRRELTDRVAEFTIGFADGRPLPSARAGAHVELRFGGADGRFLRHYSLIGPISTAVRTEPFWRIAVQREMRSRGSDFIHRTFRPNTPVLISAAQSPFRLAEDACPVLLVAGGIGITAMLPMLRSCVLRGVPVQMLYAGRSRDQMAFVGEVEAIGGDAVTIQAGGIPDLDALLAAQAPNTRCYVCGPPGLMDALRAAGARNGWPHHRIRHEIFNAAHHPEDKPVQVRLPDGREVSVDAGVTILDALERAGVDTLSDCRRGECGLCVTELRHPTEIDHRDRFLTDDQKRAMNRIAICCSRPKGDLIELNI